MTISCSDRPVYLPHALRHAAAGLLPPTGRLPGRHPGTTPGWLLALAREAGIEAPDGLLLPGSAVRLAVYRTHHAATALSASPLALDLLDHLGLDADALCLQLRPEGTWWPWLCGPRPVLAARFAGRWKGHAAPPPDPAHDRCSFLHGGLPIRRRRHGDGPLGIRLSPAGLEIAGAMGPVRFRTSGGRALLWCRAPVPATVLVCCEGRPVDALLDHPVLRGRGYRVAAVREDRRPGRAGRSAWGLVVDVPRVPWRAPWARPAPFPSTAGGPPCA